MSAATVSRMQLKVLLLPGCGDVLARTFSCLRDLLVSALRFPFDELLKSWLSGSRSSSPEGSSSSSSNSALKFTRVVLSSILLANGSMSNFGLSREEQAW